MIRKMERYNTDLHDLPKTTTYLSQLCKIGKNSFGRKFVGVFGADRIPTLGPMQSCILNTDPSSGPGTHWVALARGNGSRHYCYDSFGRKVQTLIPGLKKLQIVNAEDDAEQKIYEVNCGARCLAWLDVFYTDGIKKALSI